MAKHSKEDNREKAAFVAQKRTSPKKSNPWDGRNWDFSTSGSDSRLKK